MTEPEVNHDHLRKIFLALKLCLVFLLVYVVTATVISMRGLRTLLKPQSANGEQALGIGNGPADSPEQARDYRLILENNIFAPDDLAERTGPAQQHSSTQATDASAAQEPGLELLGTIAGSKAVSRALIKIVATGETNLYRIGQRVANAYIEAIEKEAVVLNDRGMRRTLRLDAPSRGSGASGEPRPQTVGQAETMALMDEAARAAPALSGLSKVEEILRQATIRPYSVNGQVQGLVVTGLENIPEARQFGLQDGDVVQQLNGQLLTSEQKAFQILKKARTQPQISIVLSREGVSKELAFDLW